MAASPTSPPVRVRRESVVLPTYEPHAPDLNPMFLEKRVYQGSSGRIYPLPFTDRIAEKPVPHTWDAVIIENEFIQVMILPELGGRIHRATDKTNGYEFIYYQPVIKPALVGLAGPWVSGGIEFNWPQHHRPSTYQPADVQIEEHSDGSATVWLSEHEPMGRMKGMHGVCLHPGRACLELKARVSNRTPQVQTFLWWANVATRVHDRYQSCFPPDVHYVADHAKRAMSTFPLCTGHYYGVDYAARANPKSKFQIPKSELGARAANDLSWYGNIPVPTSYMCMGTDENFFGGYDHAAMAGLVHIANHHISPGKKQWTWGNHSFGYAWDRNLTDADSDGEFAPYIELMAGVYTDNQPDFSWLQPGETKSWSQYWYPIRETGPVQQANLDAAVSLVLVEGSLGSEARIGVAVTSLQSGAVVRLIARLGRGGKKRAQVFSFVRDLSPSAPLVENLQLPRGTHATDLALSVATAGGAVLISHSPRPPTKGGVPPPATEPPLPEKIRTAEELYLTGLHLEQYRHATRQPELYWREALRRDPLDARCNTALGRWHLRRGEWSAAEKHLRQAIARLTSRNPNPADGEAHYQLGLCLRQRASAEFQNPNSRIKNTDAAYAAFFKATWNQAWQGAGYHALAEIDCVRHDWLAALDHLERALRANADNLRARNLKVMVLRLLDRPAEATVLLAETLALDPLDWWARQLRGDRLSCDTQVRLDLVLDFARAGFYLAALNLLDAAVAEPRSGTAPLLGYYRAWLCHLLGDKRGQRRALAAAAKASPDYSFPARLEEIPLLELAIAASPQDARAPYYLGNLLYDRRRHREAIRLWETSARLDPSFSIVWRNLGLGYFNILHRPHRARAAYDRALRCNPADARLLYERDQLWKRLAVAPAKRLHELTRRRPLVRQRDDLSVELCALYNQTGQPAKALAIVTTRRFQPWEGGEGQALGQHVRTHLALGRQALAQGDAAEARRLFTIALTSPENLGEAKHLLANQSDLHFWLGEASAAAGDAAAARLHWDTAATFKGDFQEMSVRAFSELTYYSALALERLGRRAAARKLLRDLLAYARRLERTPAKIDYFATSLPTMLVFEDDLQRRQTITAKFLQGQALLGLGRRAAARRLFTQVLRLDPAHPRAGEFTARCEVVPVRWTADRVK